MPKESITKEMLVSQIIKKYPESLEVFYKYDIDACCWENEALELAAQALFDFDKYELKPEGKAAIDRDVISKLGQVTKLELILVTGHTDRIGTQAYNQKLSERRANAVRDYMVSKGVAKDKIETLGMGKTQPVTGGKCQQKNWKELIACLAPDRRVDVEVKGEAVKR